MIGSHCSILDAQAPCGNDVWVGLLRLPWPVSQADVLRKHHRAAVLFWRD